MTDQTPDLNSRLKKIVDIDPSIAGDEFYQQLAERLTSVGASLEQDGGLALSELDDEGLALMSDSAFAKITSEMEENIRVSEETNPTSHRSGAVGSFHRFVKKIVIYLKLASDEQVIQQAHFNRAAFAALQLAKVREKRLEAKMDQLRDEIKKYKKRCRLGPSTR